MAIPKTAGKLRDIIDQAIMNTMNLHEGSRIKTATDLGVTPEWLYDRLDHMKHRGLPVHPPARGPRSKK